MTHWRAEVVTNLVSESELRYARGHAITVVDERDDARVERTVHEPTRPFVVLLINLADTPGSV